MSRYEEIDLSRVRKVPLSSRENKVSISDFVTLPTRNEIVFPDVLKGQDLPELVKRLRSAKIDGKPIIWGMGGHVLKCGLSPILIDLMRRGWVQGLVMNGSVSIHDCEIALIGATSEDVGVNMVDGSFGMAAETAAFIAKSLHAGRFDELGYGEALGKAIAEEQLPYSEYSLLATAAMRF